MTLTAENVILDPSASDLIPRTRLHAATKVDAVKIDVRELRLHYLEDWQSLRSCDTNFQSPYFSFEYVEAVSAVRNDISVLLIRRGGRVIGFLPIQETGSGHTVPAGGLYNDSHGILFDSRRDEISYIDVLKSAGLKSYRFHALPVITQESREYRYGAVRSFLADLDRHPHGYHRFLEETRGTIFKQRRKTKKMIKDLGSMRLEFDCRSPEVLRQIIEMKRSQYQRTNIFDILSVTWVHELFNELVSKDERNDKCRLNVSALYAGNTLVAGHIGMIEGEVLHYWFPAYDLQYHVYSPGTAMFLEIANSAPEHGVKKVDFGYGEQPYKLKLTDTVSEMQFGSFDVSRTRWYAHKHVSAIKLMRKQLPFRENIKSILRRFAPNFGAKNY